MNRRLIVTGAQGFVAGSVLAQAGSGWSVHAISRTESAQAKPFSWYSCDPLKPQELEGLFRKIQPDALIHCAAIADIDVAEQNPELARAVNVEMTRTLVSLCHESGCRMVFCSTDTIFDGEHAPYDEQDNPEPVNYYGLTKVEAEEIVRGLGEQAVIARLAIVMGLPVMGSGNSFLARMLRNLREGQVVIAPAKEIRTPVDVITAGQALLELAGGSQSGIFHLAGRDRLNRLELAQRIAARLNLDSNLIQPRSPAEPARRAPRPRDVSLNNTRARAELKTPMRNLDEALSLILERD